MECGHCHCYEYIFVKEPKIYLKELRMEEQTSRMEWLQKVRQSLSLLSLEPIVFLQTFTWGLASVIGQNLIIDKVCR